MQPELERTTTTAITSSIRGLLLFLLVVCLFSVPVEISFAQDAGQTHVVRPGEYLSTIASRYGVSLSALIRANGISNPNLVRAGQVLIIPGGAPPAPAGGGARHRPQKPPPPAHLPPGAMPRARPACRQPNTFPRFNRTQRRSLLPMTYSTPSIRASRSRRLHGNLARLSAQLWPAMACHLR
jgi:LysM repeat protein